MLSLEKKKNNKEMRIKRRTEREKEIFESAYAQALKDPSLPSFRIKDNIMFIRIFSSSKFNKIKRVWKNKINNQINNYSFESLCDTWNEPFFVGIRNYNPHDQIIQYFYHKHQIDLMEMKYEIVKTL